LLLPISFGANAVDMQILSPTAGLDFMTTFDDWLSAQRGGAPAQRPTFGSKRFISTARDLTGWVHVDAQFEAYLLAHLILQAAHAPLNPGNPYRTSVTEIGIGMLGELAQVSANALRAIMYSKWYVHRRLRPEVFAARVDRTLYHGANYPVHADILNSLSSTSRLGRYVPAGNALLSQAYPEGCPTHPSYGAAHATVAGACGTLLKAIFDETWTFPNPVQPSDDGSTLVSYSGAPLTLGGEVNKLASNIALARDMAGVHWRSDSTQALLQGEAIAIQFLREAVQLFNEPMHFSFTTFDGSAITI
jgi:hypothetical protein